MKKGKDIAVEYPGLCLIHHNLPGSQLEPHTHVEHQVFIPLQGELHFAFEDEEIVCGAGRMIYLPPAVAHSFRSSQQSGERLIAMITAKRWDSAGGTAHQAKVLPVSQLCKELLFYLLLNPGTKHHKSLIDTLVQTLDETIVAGSDSRMLQVDQLLAKVGDARVQKAVAALRVDLADTPSLPQIAKQAGLSVRTMNRLFMVELGLTPKQFLTQVRILKAQDLLKNSNLSVTNVALEVGYSSLSAFIKAYQQLTGQLPSEAKLGQKL